MDREVLEIYENSKKLCKIWNELANDNKNSADQIDDYFNRLAMQTTIIGKTTVREILEIFAELYDFASDKTKQKIDKIKKNLEK